MGGGKCLQIPNIKILPRRFYVWGKVLFICEENLLLLCFEI